MSFECSWGIESWFYHLPLVIPLCNIIIKLPVPNQVMIDDDDDIGKMNKLHQAKPTKENSVFSLHTASIVLQSKNSVLLQAHFLIVLSQ